MKKKSKHILYELSIISDTKITIKMNFFFFNFYVVELISKRGLRSYHTESFIKKGLIIYIYIYIYIYI